MRSGSTVKCSKAELNPVAVAVAAVNAGTVPPKSVVCLVTQFQLNCVVPCVRGMVNAEDGLAFGSSPVLQISGPIATEGYETRKAASGPTLAPLLNQSIPWNLTWVRAPKSSGKPIEGDLRSRKCQSK